MGDNGSVDSHTHNVTERKLFKSSAINFLRLIPSTFVLIHDTILYLVAKNCHYADVKATLYLLSSVASLPL